MRKPDSGKVWLEPLLTRHLSQVPAPPGLWERVDAAPPNAVMAPPRTGRPKLAPKLVWTLATAALVVAVVAAWGIATHFGVAPTNEALAAQVLLRGSGQLEFRSEEAAQIQSWIKGRTGLDIPLLADQVPSIHLVGASVAAGGPVPTAEIVYRLNDGEAVLLVSKADPNLTGGATHRFLSSGQYRGARVSTWVMRGQLCTLACPIHQNPYAACQLCHATGAPRAILN